MSAPNPYDMMTPEEAAAERRAALRWGAIIIGILGTSFTVAMIMLYVSATDPSFAVEPDYYEKAINWDQHAAQAQANNELGWTISLGTGPSATPGARTITAHCADREGAAIDNATITAVAFHNARSGDRFEFPMRAAGSGIYTAEQPLQRAGRWEFRLTAVDGETTFTATIQTELAPLPRASASR